MQRAMCGIRIEKRTAVVELAERVADANGLTDLSYGLAEICRQVRENSDIKVMVLTDAAENAFSMGGAIIEQAARLPEAASSPIQRMVESIAEFDRPVIAAIRGDAIGFGLELALACDIRIAATASRFGLPHVKKGLLPWYGGSQRLPRIVGQAKALEMMLTGEPVDARTAKETGLVCKVVAEAEVMQEAMRMAEILAQKGPLAMSCIKEAVHKGMDHSIDQGLRLEADLYFLLHTTEDRKEGIRAFQERRPANFAGK